MKFDSSVEKYRAHHPLGYSHKSGDTFGWFVIPSCYDGKTLMCMAIEDGGGWDHVSVSRADRRMPRWQEMCQIKEMFWNDDESVVQFHPPKKDNVSFHDTCLHLWKYRNAEFPMPPKDFVGPAKG